MEDSGLDEMMDESEQTETEDSSQLPGKDVFSPDAILDQDDEGVDMHSGTTPPADSDFEHFSGPIVRTLDGELAGDEFAQDAINYQILLGKIDALLDKLKLDA